MLGASVESARLAAESDWNFIFAAHLNGDKALLHEVLSFWQANSSRPTIVAVQVIVADSSDMAAQLAEDVQIWGVELEDGQRVTVASEEQALAFAAQAGSAPRTIARREQALLHGSAQEVVATLRSLQVQYGIDEFIIDTPVAEGQARLHRYACWRKPIARWRLSDVISLTAYRLASRATSAPGAVPPGSGDNRAYS